MATILVAPHSYCPLTGSEPGCDDGTSEAVRAAALILHAAGAPVRVLDANPGRIRRSENDLNRAVARGHPLRRLLRGILTRPPRLHRRHDIPLFVWDIHSFDPAVTQERWAVDPLHNMRILPWRAFHAVLMDTRLSPSLIAPGSSRWRDVLRVYDTPLVLALARQKVHVGVDINTGLDNDITRESRMTPSVANSLLIELRIRRGADSAKDGQALGERLGRALFTYIRTNFA